jgi:mannitol/fructose-specific phosphotransferase system IIA component
MIGVSETPFVEIILNRSYASRRDVIEAIGDVMLASASVTAPYVDGMLRKEEQASTVVTAEVALPHGTSDVKHAVLRNAIVVVPIPDGIEWTPSQRVRLAIGFAGVGDQAHVRLLGALARILSDDQLVARLKTATRTDDVGDLVARLTI